MRLTELHRTTGFRLATLFLMLFGVIAMLLFGYLYREITGFEQERIDDWLMREHAQLQREEPDDLVARFEHQNQFDPRHHPMFPAERHGQIRFDLGMHGTPQLR